MFKISYIVDDRRLPDVLRATAGHVSGLEVVPVPNVEVIPEKPRSHHKMLPALENKVRETAPGPRNFIQELGWKSGRQFGGNDVGERCASLGLNYSSRFHVIGHEVKHHRVKKVRLGKYRVL